MPLTAPDLHAWIRAFADRVAEERAYLTKLDSAIGDGDHGQNMNRGLSHAVDQIDDDASMSDTMRTVAMALISKTGGASGPLYGTLFMDAGKTTAEHEELGTPEVAALFRAGLNGVQRRGKAEPNDKTMVDALLPAVEALEDAAENGTPLSEAIQQAANAAKKGMEATTPLEARKGRASYLGERSKGHQDPGATSTYYLLDAAATAWSDRA
ncbi:dihydroxyacetone kinase subunit L [Longimonas halophila]|uniref:Dihydroxyacetone kinase subunit L n=1 Tax=Longimonas halophila TaxID=1469170 RepID=A0A2H3P7F5_9BACT|nr:dihydroxyacetone kinase subunit DhaL [Longimonas halophila]PEN08478.1 dihydroxyacetone kinase subunit L [Longimonas halophila]